MAHPCKSTVGIDCLEASSPPTPLGLPDIILLLSSAWGTKGDTAATANDLEVTVGQLWQQGLSGIRAMAAIFVNPDRGVPHSPQAAANFHRVFKAMTDAANNSSDKDIGAIAIARAAADLLTSGHIIGLFGSKFKESAALLAVIAKALRHVSTQQQANVAYVGVPWNEAIMYGEFIAATKLDGAQLDDPWSVITIELLARIDPNLAKAVVSTLLYSLEREVTNHPNFSAGNSVSVAALKTILVHHAPTAGAAFKEYAAETPQATSVLIQIVKKWKLFGVFGDQVDQWSDGEVQQLNDSSDQEESCQSPHEEVSETEQFNDSSDQEEFQDEEVSESDHFDDTEEVSTACSQIPSWVSELTSVFFEAKVLFASFVVWCVLVTYHWI